MKISKVFRKIWIIVLLIVFLGLFGIGAWDFISSLLDGTATVKHICCTVLEMLFFAFIAGSIIYYGFIHPDEVDTTNSDLEKANEMFAGKSKWEIITTAIVNTILVALGSFFLDWLSDKPIQSFMHYAFTGASFVMLGILVYGAVYLYHRHRN